jgi:hypothetical protein
VSLERATVLAALRAEDVASHLGIVGQWRGRWMRSRRCATADHGAEAFGLARDGVWHCHVCDTGGDLLKLIALAEGLDVRADFGKVLEIAAGIAGVEDDESFGATSRPPAKARPALPPAPPLAQRVATAKRRAAWAWDRLAQRNELQFSVADIYLRHMRGLDPAVIRAAEDIRDTPLRCTMDEMCRFPDLKSLAYLFATPGVAVPVRCVTSGELVDVRVRRAEPRPDQPKIVGMLGGVTAGPAEAGKPRTLVGCYGRPSVVDTDLVVVVEGLVDYLTGLQVWPNATVLGAVDAGSLELVAAHAARQLAGRDNSSRMIIVEQADQEGQHRDGTKRIGAADASVNEHPNAAAKAALRILGPARVGWVYCGVPMIGMPDSTSTKDLNDMVRMGLDPTARVEWERDR